MAGHEFASLFQTIPGLCILPAWFCMYFLLWLACNTLSTDLPVEPSHILKETIVVRSDYIVFAFAACIFGASILLSYFSSILQISPVKRRLASLFFFIDTVAFTTNITQFFQVFPDLRQDKPFDWVHYFQWGFTTSTMLVTLNSFGNHESSLVSGTDWAVMHKALIADWLMLMPGGLVVRLLLLTAGAAGG